ncbi:MAG: hypothetical protein CL522_01090 [Actinobacteria bacterium]|nr:hypothetical protein [Actinomycetota bacterium]
MVNKDDNPSGNWEPDPYHRHDQRWWSGSRWSQKVKSDSEIQIDPPGVVPRPVDPLSLGRPVDPISGVREPLWRSSPYVPHLLILGFLLLAGSCILTIFAVFG